jgi:hypothetical protein
MTFDLTRDEIWFLKALRAAGERGRTVSAPTSLGEPELGALLICETDFDIAAAGDGLRSTISRISKGILSAS